MVDVEFWRQRWESRQIGFHEGKPNALLDTHVGRLDGATRVLVPLSGKAVDMLLLASRGMSVVGVEAVEAPCREFFDDNALAYRVEEKPHGGGRAKHFIGDAITIVCGDVFACGSAELGTFDAVYDRAALIALDPTLRAQYVATIAAMLAPRARTLLVTFTYDQSKIDGPPWSVDEKAVRALWKGATIERVLTREVPRTPKFVEANVPRVHESLFCIKRR